MRRPRFRLGVADLMLSGTTLLAGMNSAISKYVLSHGWSPPVYSTFRFFCVVWLFFGVARLREGRFLPDRRDVRKVLVLGVVAGANQLVFVYALHLAAAATVALIFGALPIFMGVGAQLMGIERMGRRFWLASLVSLTGVGLVAFGGGGVAGSTLGVLLAFGASASWAAYSLLATPLMETYSAIRVNGFMMAVAWFPIAAVGIPQATHQTWSFGTLTWLGVGFAIVGPLFLSNIFFFAAIRRVGPSRAGLFINLQPFVGAVAAVILLGEALGRWEIAGASLIAVAIVVERWKQPLPVPVAAPEE